MKSNRVKQPAPSIRAAGRPEREVAVWCQRFEATCRERGIRVTPQRLALYGALAGDTGHPTAEVLLARLRPQLPSLSPASVYRILESLEAEGLVRRVSTPGGVSRYDANIAPHQHLVCRVCGRIDDVENDALAGLRLPAPDPAGFTAEAFDIRVVGVCAPCGEKER